MRELSNSFRPTSSSKVSGEDRNFTDSFTGEGYKSVIDKANTVPISKLFKLYGLKLDEINRKITCPFKTHKGGRENTASFYYYPHTNTYHCYGCKQGNTPIDFIINMERCSAKKAAIKILENFSEDVDEDLILNKDDFSEKLKILISYSDEVRLFRLNHINEEDFNFIEDNCQTFDKICQRHDLNADALKVVVSKLIDNIKKYKI